MSAKQTIQYICLVTVFAIMVIISAELAEEHLDSDAESLERRSALPGRRRLRGRARGRGQRPALSDMTSLQQRQWTSEEMMAFAPGTPSPDQVECHVEVQITRVVGGRCVHLGTSGPRACQSGPHLDIFNTVCNNREPTEDENQESASAITTPLPPQ